MSDALHYEIVTQCACKSDRRSRHSTGIGAGASFSVAMPELDFSHIFSLNSPSKVTTKTHTSAISKPISMVFSFACVFAWR
jgi:hypothetical protein